jgi:uncharacterized membrane protein YfcA
MDNLFLFILFALIAEIIGTVSGFGSSVLFIPLAALFFDFKVVLGITAVFHVFSNVFKIYLFRQGVDRYVLFRLGIPAVIFVIIGAILTAFIPVRMIEIGLSVMLLVLSFVMIFSQKFNIKKTQLNLVFGGALSGFLAGLLGTGGAIRGMTLIAFELEKSAFVATSALIDLGVDASRAGVYIWNGYFSKEYLTLIPALLFVAWVGSWIGKKILERTSNANFRIIVLVVIIGTSLSQLFKVIWNM